MTDWPPELVEKVRAVGLFKCDCRACAIQLLDAIRDDIVLRSRDPEMAYGYLMEQVERVQAQNEELLERAERAEAAAGITR